MQLAAGWIVRLDAVRIDALRSGAGRAGRAGFGWAVPLCARAGADRRRPARAAAGALQAGPGGVRPAAYRRAGGRHLCGGAARHPRSCCKPGSCTTTASGSPSSRTTSRTSSSQLSLLLSNAERHIANPEFQRDMLDTIGASVEQDHHLIRRLDEPSADRAPGRTRTPAAAGASWRPRTAASAKPRRRWSIDGPRRPGGRHACHDAFDTAFTHLLNNAVEAAPGTTVADTGIVMRWHQVVIDIVDKGPRHVGGIHPRAACSGRSARPSGTGPASAPSRRASWCGRAEATCRRSACRRARIAGVRNGFGDDHADHVAACRWRRCSPPPLAHRRLAVYGGPGMSLPKLLIVEDDMGLCSQYRWAFPSLRPCCLPTPAPRRCRWRPRNGPPVVPSWTSACRRTPTASARASPLLDGMSARRCRTPR